ncbi:MAG: protein-disulfide reductase DsbD domain-containing protein [Mesorhizobium sp.]
MVSHANDGHVRLEWAIAPGYYLYQDRFDLTLGQAELTVPQAEGNPQSKADPTFGVTTVYHDRVALAVPLAKGAGSLEVHYQGCQENGICYSPQVRHVDATTLAVGTDGGPANTALGQQWSKPVPEKSAGAIAIAADSGGMVGSLLQRGGIPMALGSFVLFGMFLAFTPCVFPMYPILAGTIARQGERLTALRGFTLSLAYVLAMATAFGLLGVAAAWSGQNLQMALQSPLAIGAVSALFSCLCTVDVRTLRNAIAVCLGRCNRQHRQWPALRADGTLASIHMGEISSEMLSAKIDRIAALR